MAIQRKRWKTLVGRGEWFHLARFRFLPARPSSLHTHDFPEIFWIEAGEALHCINGRRERLVQGQLVFVRARDVHVLQAVDAPGFTLVNLAFDPRVLADLRRRYARPLAAFHDPAAPFPRRCELNDWQLEQLTDSVIRLGRAERQRMPLEHFLLGLYQVVRMEGAPGSPLLPDWLERACRAAQRPETFAQGARGFVAAAGRSPEYVARACRARLGVTPTGYVNRVRMDHAARELRLGAKPILDIALECGFSNLAHFYALFKSAHGQTPRRYRLFHHRPIV